MTPKYGGSPLPASPICLPGEHHKAEAYVILVGEAMKQAGWSSTQRRRLRDLVRLWTWRAEGRDPQFEQYGSFGRRPGSAPPTALDATVEAWRRLAPQSPEGKQARRMPWRVNEHYRDEARYRRQDRALDKAQKP